MGVLELEELVPVLALMSDAEVSFTIESTLRQLSRHDSHSLVSVREVSFSKCIISSPKVERVILEVVGGCRGHVAVAQLQRLAKVE